MKRLLPIFLSVGLPFLCSAQVNEFLDISIKKEFAGIPFLSAPDYSKLEYKNRSPKGVNIYTLKGVELKTAAFTLSEVYVSVQKGKVMNFLLPIKTENDYSKILRVLTEAFATKTELGDNKVFHGDNILFSLIKGQSGYNLFLATKDTDTIPEIKDKNGITDLLGKKDTDPAVVKLIASIPGKKEKKEYSTGGYGYTWQGEGIVIEFNGKEGEAKLNNIIVYFMKDNYYWKYKPFKGVIKLPYDITANTSLLQLRDMFGDEDSGFGSSSWRTKSYREFKVYCNFGDPVKQNNSELLNHITIK